MLIEYESDAHSQLLLLIRLALVTVPLFLVQMSLTTDVPVGLCDYCVGAAVARDH